MGVAFMGSFVPILFFIIKQIAIVMSAVSNDDRNPLTHTDNDTARNHYKVTSSLGCVF